MRREGLERSLAAIREFIAFVAKNEPGTLKYESFQERDDPTKFGHVFVFRDQDGERIHSSSAAAERFTAALYPECLQPVVFTDVTLIASTESRP